MTDPRSGGELSAERWQVLEPLLDAALERPRDERSAFLEQACRGDPESLRDLRQMLALCERLDTGSAPSWQPAAGRFSALLEEDDRSGLERGLDGRYRIEGIAGRGGMAVVYRAWDLRHRRTVALKVLDTETSQAGAARFRREVELAAGLQHPNILPVFDSGETDGRLWYTMPFVEGESLEERLRRGPLPLAEAVRLLRELGEALAEAHARGIVHRDLKPDNVLLSAGHAVIADFGIAKALGAEPSQHADRTTVTGTAIGTPAYMAPEQIAADPAMDHRVDLYALGVIMYRLLTGILPFSQAASRQALLAAHLVETPEPPSSRRPDIPPGLDDLVLRLLAKAPGSRPASAGKVLAELDRLGTAAPTVEPRPAKPSLVRLRSPQLLIPLAVGVFAAGLVLFLPGTQVHQRKRVQIHAFESVPGDSQFTRFGRTVADAIEDELLASGLVDVVPRDERSSSRVDYRIVGGITLAHDSLVASLRIEDLASGQRLPDRGALAVGRSDQTALIDSLRRRVTTALAQVTDRQMERWNMGGMPANIEAYYAFRDGLDAMSRGRFAEARNHWDRAAALDTNYMQPLLHGTSARLCLFDYAGADSLVKVVARHAVLDRADRAYFEMNRATMDGDADRFYQAAVAMVDAAPGAELPRFFVALGAMALNRPREALEAGNGVNYHRGKFRYDWAGSGFLMVRSDAWHLLGRYDRELKQVREGLTLFPDHRDLKAYEAEALMALGRIAEAESVANRALALQRPTGMPTHPETMLRLAGEFRYHGYPDASRRVLERLLAWERSRPAAEQNDTLAYFTALTAYSAGDYGEADSLVQALLQHSPNDPRALVLHGAVAWQLGQRARSDSVLTRLQAYRDPLFQRFVDYGLAQLLAQRGETARAMEFLTRSLDTGMRFAPRFDHKDLLLAPLWSLPEYTALFQRRG